MGNKSIHVPNTNQSSIGTCPLPRLVLVHLRSQVPVMVLPKVADLAMEVGDFKPLGPEAFGGTCLLERTPKCLRLRFLARALVEGTWRPPEAPSDQGIIR